MKNLLLALPLCASAVALAAAAKCPIAGAVDQWAADFCMYSAGTDDLIHLDVVACLNKQLVNSDQACLAKTKLRSATLLCKVVPIPEPLSNV